MACNPTTVKQLSELAQVPWPRDVAAAREVQERLRGRVSSSHQLECVEYVAGIDVGFEQAGRVTRAAVVVLEYDSLRVCDQVVSRGPTRFPYVPGYLSFRELPQVLLAMSELSTVPDLLLCDAQGFAHPRRFGLACHLGVLTGIASIGVAKSRLIGTHDTPPLYKGGWTPLRDAGEVIGAVLRTRSNVSPVYVSIGHRVDLPHAIDYVLHCTPRFRLPETTRRAHQLASAR